MVGKVVKVVDPNLITFFYPTFKIRTELSILDRDLDIIYVGPMKRGLIDQLSSGTKRFISTVGVPDIDLTNRESALKWLFSKSGKEPPVDLVEQAKTYDDDYFYFCMKVYWITGRWVGLKSDSDITLYSLFSSTSESLRKTIETYYKLIEDIPTKVVEASFLTFLSRVKNLEEQNAKPGYMKLLKVCDGKFGQKIKPAVYKIATREGLRDELLFIDLITELR